MGGDNVACKISERTKKLTTKCPFNFACMTNHKWDTCSSKRALPETFLVIKTKKNSDSCPYVFSFSNSYYCHCPTRFEIYQRHNI